MATTDACGGCGEPAHEPNDECWWVDLAAACPYFARYWGHPRHDPEAVCAFNCRDEPECVTYVPVGGWPSQRTER